MLKGRLACHRFFVMCFDGPCRMMGFSTRPENWKILFCHKGAKKKEKKTFRFPRNFPNWNIHQSVLCRYCVYCHSHCSRLFLLIFFVFPTPWLSFVIKNMNVLYSAINSHVFIICFLKVISRAELNFQHKSVINQKKKALPDSAILYKSKNCAILTLKLVTCCSALSYQPK